MPVARSTTPPTSRAARASRSRSSQAEQGRPGARRPGSAGRSLWRGQRLDLFQKGRKTRDMTGADVEVQLREAGLRVTRQRVAVLTVLHDHPHTDTDTVIRRVREVAGD